MKGIDSDTPWKQLFASDELPALGPEPRLGRPPLAKLAAEINDLNQTVKLDEAKSLLIQSLFFLWHDYLNESHALSQEIHTPDGSYLHGMMHRREPDYWNAKYWFHRVGAHPASAEIAHLTGTALAEEPALQKLILPGGSWDPAGFVDACEQAAKGKLSTNQVNLLQQIQAIEFHVLLEEFLKS